MTTNNLQIAFVDVREGGGRILYLEGQQRLEQTFLRRSLRRFPDLDLTDNGSQVTRLLRGRSTSVTRSDLASSISTCSVISIPVHSVMPNSTNWPTPFPPVQVSLTLGGFQAYGAGGYASSPLADVLPMRNGQLSPTHHRCEPA